MSKISQIKRVQFVSFFITIWVFFSLNSRFFRIPNADIIRWISLGILVILSLIIIGNVSIEVPSIVLMFSIAVLPSVFLGIYIKESIIKFVSFFFVIIGVHIFFSSLQNIEEMELILKIFFIIVVLFEVQSVICVFLGVGYDEDGGRALGVTANSNTLGIYSAISFWASIYLFKSNTNKILKIFFVCMVLFSVYLAVASGSRSAFVIIFFDIVILVFFEVKNKVVVFIVFLLFLFLLLLFLNGKLNDLNITVLNRFAEQGTDRGDLWNYGIAKWRERLIFGYGYMVSDEVNKIEGLQFHNSYLSFLIDCGLWGMICMVLGIIVFVNKIIIYIKSTMTYKSLSLFIICICIILNIGICAWGESFLFAVGSTEGFSFWFLVYTILAYIKKGGITKK